MEKKMENEMETGIICGIVAASLKKVIGLVEAGLFGAQDLGLGVQSFRRLALGLLSKNFGMLHRSLCGLLQRYFLVAKKINK